MNLVKQNILGVGISAQTKQELIEEVSTYLEMKSEKPLTIVTPNPEQVVYAQEDPHFKEILNSADIALPDGVGVVWGVKLGERGKGKGEREKKIERIPGIEFAEELLVLASEKNYVVGFIGGRNGVAQKALEKLQKKYLRLKGWGENGPEVEVQSSKLEVQSSDKEKYFSNAVERIKNTNTQLLFIGLGAPKQEYFIANLKSQVPMTNYKEPLVIMVVGGAFDVWSGRIARAPELARNLGLEWLWRLVQEPWRIGRQLQLVKFVYLVLTRNYL